MEKKHIQKDREVRYIEKKKEDENQAFSVADFSYYTSGETYL